MEPFAFDIDAYLTRVNLGEPVPPTAQGLATLQRAQFFNIPFENFDIQLGRGVDLAPANLFDKLVRRPRGGYCFEVNGLLLMALVAFGFAARPLLARVHLTGEPSGRGHQIALVDIDDRRWIADVGFGRNNPRAPLELKRDVEQTVAGRTFRLADGGEFGTMLQSLTDGQWQDLYSFDMEHVCPADIRYGNHYTSTHPNSFFTHTRVAVLPLDNGMATLCDQRLTLERDEREERIILPEGPSYLAALKEHFGIELDAPFEALRPVADRDPGPSI